MLTRRGLLAGMVLPVLVPCIASAQPYSFDKLVDEAQQLARAPYRAPEDLLPPDWASLDFDRWRQIRFRPERAFLGETGPYRLQLFHRGFLHKDAVAISLLKDGTRQPIAYGPDLFDFGSLSPEALPRLANGIAGFRLHAPLNDPNVLDEAISFLGASYFRFLSRGQHYGLSARALAVNAGMEGQAEEFPAFRAMIVHEPDPDGRITVDGLLDSVSLTGAFRLQLRTGEPSIVEIETEVFARETISRLGIAPLTSMYFFSESGSQPAAEYRPELHDSDGLLMHRSSGEWLWRPLQNPQTANVSSFADRNPRGFGLMQRDQNFQHYQDLDLRYHKRPGYWISPLGDWGKGAIDLLELPTADETNDNIVAFWRPEEPLQAGGRMRFAYRITALSGTQSLSAGGFAVNSFHTAARALGSSEPDVPGTQRFLIDFAGGNLERIPVSALELVISAGNGRVLRNFLVPNPEIGGVRAGFDVAGRPGETVDLRVFIRRGPDALTETWTFPWQVR